MRSITLAPLPKLRHIFLSIFNPPASDADLSDLWCRTGDLSLWFSRSTWSLVFIAKWRKLLYKKNICVWVPDYFCNASLMPLRKLGVELVFYPITLQKNPDLRICKNLALKYRVDIFVLVHYFGEAFPVDDAIDFCKHNSAWLVEDATHVFLPEPGIGEKGNFVIYSPHKHLPIPDGAVLVIRPFKGSEYIPHQSVISNLSDGSIFAKLYPLAWIFKRTGQYIGIRKRSLRVSFFDVNTDGVDLFKYYSMSTLSKKMLTFMLSEINEISSKHKRNEENWQKMLAWASLGSTVKSKILGAHPYLARFSNPDGGQVGAAYTSLQLAGLPVTSWPDLPPEVFSNIELHSSAIFHRLAHFYLPVHQSISEKLILECGKDLLCSLTLRWHIKSLGKDEWLVYWEKCTDTNLMQSWQYGEAKAKVDGCRVDRLLISDENYKPIAIVQVLLKGWRFPGQLARINRGPLLLFQCPDQCMISYKMAALTVIIRYGSLKHWKCMQAALEAPPSVECARALNSLGFVKLKTNSWASGRLNLTIGEQELLMALDGKWRNSMRKGVKEGIKVVMSEIEDKSIDQLILSYKSLQVKRGFVGISDKLIRALIECQGKDLKINIFTAYKDGVEDISNSIGVLVTAHTGDTATYLIGLTNEEGRLLQANSVMLWNAILLAKRVGCRWFDIGGLNKSTPKGIASFKLGLNAQPYELIGEWRKWWL